MDVTGSLDWIDPAGTTKCRISGVYVDTNPPVFNIRISKSASIIMYNKPVSTQVSDVEGTPIHPENESIILAARENRLVKVLPPRTITPVNTPTDEGF